LQALLGGEALYQRQPRAEGKREHVRAAAARRTRVARSRTAKRSLPAQASRRSYFH
jgi:hypothetical protein